MPADPLGNLSCVDGQASSDIHPTSQVLNQSQSWSRARPLWDRVRARDTWSDNRSFSCTGEPHVISHNSWFLCPCSEGLSDVLLHVHVCSFNWSLPGAGHGGQRATREQGGAITLEVEDDIVSALGVATRTAHIAPETLHNDWTPCHVVPQLSSAWILFDVGWIFFLFNSFMKVPRQTLLPSHIIARY